MELTINRHDELLTLPQLLNPNLLSTSKNALMKLSSSIVSCLPFFFELLQRITTNSQSWRPHIVSMFKTTGSLFSFLVGNRSGSDFRKHIANIPWEHIDQEKLFRHERAKCIKMLQFPPYAGVRLYPPRPIEDFDSLYSLELNASLSPVNPETEDEGFNMQFTDAFLEGNVIWRGIPEGYEHMRNQESEDGLYTFAVQYQKDGCGDLGLWTLYCEVGEFVECGEVAERECSRLCEEMGW